MLMMVKILHLSQKKKKKEIFNELVDEKRGKVTDLDKKKLIVMI